MGCAASATDSAERRRRGRSPGHRETSTTAATGLLAARHDGKQQQQQDGRRRGCKVAPEPKEEDGAFVASMPGSPSFRIYCQNSAAVDALVADADGDGGGDDSDGCVRITETPQPIKNNGHGSGEFSKSAPEASRWVRFRGLALAAWCSLFSSRHSNAAASAPSHPPPAAAAKSHQRFDAAAPATEFLPLVLN